MVTETATLRQRRGTSAPIRRGLVLGTMALLLARASPALAVHQIATEENIADLLATPMISIEEAEKVSKERQWAILPELGYDPESGGLGGIKFTDRNIAGSGVTLDTEAVYEVHGQQGLTANVGTPHLLDDRFLTMLELDYYFDPRQDFFGLGNNDIGPDEASTHAFEPYMGTFTFGWRPWPQLALNASVGLRHVRIGRGKHDDGFPFTLDAFPNLAGVQGGFVNPFSLSLVWNSRDDVLLPTRGWRGILKVTHTNRHLLSDYQFTRLDADLGYLQPLVASGRHVLSVRVNGGLLAGPNRAVPFWELEDLGGDDTLRGFFPHRFLGNKRILFNAEYRFPIWGFDFFHFWYVHVGGVVFSSVGRVFMSPTELEKGYGLDHAAATHLTQTPQYDYGLGLRFAVAKAILARVDVGFSEENTGLVYLAFGHTF